MGPVRACGHRLLAARAPAPQVDAPPQSDYRVVTTLDELDALLASAETAFGRSFDEGMREFARFGLELDLAFPEDPYSPEYLDQVFAAYELVSERPYDVSCERTAYDVEESLTRPFPYATESSQLVGDQLMAMGHVIKTMALAPRSSVLELGAGSGNTALALAQLGHRVTTLDVDPKSARLIQGRAHRLGIPIDAREGDFAAVAGLDEQFEAVLFVASFHHSADHLALLRDLDRIVRSGGAIVFCAEPIVESFPLPWGLRLDGESLWQIRRNGWLELGFKESYFHATLERFGWRAERHDCKNTPWGVVYIARRTAEQPAAGA